MRALVLVPLLLLTACSGGSTTATPTATPTAAPTAAPATEAPTATPTTEAPSPTPSPTPTATPTRARGFTDGDVDGDGKRDVIQPSATLLKVTLSSTGKVLTAPVHKEDPGPATLLGTGDVDGDGRAEVFLETAEGASTQFATPYRFDGTTLRELQLDGGPARLGIGGSVTHGDGFRCVGGLLEIRQAESTDGTTFTVRADRYAIRGDQLVLTGSSTSKGTQGSPAVESAYNADCGSVGD
jgi:hypothetical protein